MKLIAWYFSSFYNYAKVSKNVNPADFLGAKVLTPMEQDSVKGGVMRCSQQQQQQQQQQQALR